ncbi:MAG: hypothetical protein ACI8ZA_002746, partial [Gammaproteobacteria bacterium]
MLINLQAKLLGIALCLLIGIIATIVATRYQVPIILFALLMGLSLH